MDLEIVSPEATLFKGAVVSVTVPGVNGAFEMLKDHAPIVSTLTAGVIKICGDISLRKEVQDQFVKSERNTTLLTINSGTLEMKANKLIILVD